jgi:hypothetical protein
MKEWFYPGRITGLEFIYPKEQAMEIARHATEPVLTASASDLHDLASIEVEAIQPLGKETTTTTSASNLTKVENAPSAEEKPGEPAVQEPARVVQENENKSTSTVQNQDESKSTVTTETEVQREKPAETSTTNEENQNPETRELPRTAGELSLTALIGMLCLGAGLGMKVLSSRS